MKILFCVQASAQHAARWINLFEDRGWDLHVYENLLPGYGINPEFRCGCFHLPYPATTPPGTEAVSSLRRSIKARLSVKLGRGIPPALARKAHEEYLAWLIRDLKPDVIHMLGLAVNWRNQATPLVAVRERLGGRLPAPLMYTVWGNDLEVFGHMKREREGVERFLRCVDYCVTECDRDTRLASQMGFSGHFCGKIPQYGGADMAAVSKFMAPGPSSARRLIVLKGRDHAEGGDPIGRAMVAMKAFALCAEALKPYRIAILQASPVVKAEAATLAAVHGLDIQVLPRLSYDGLKRLMGAARIVMAITVNEGLPSTLVEAMSFGALPLHSDLEPIREWVGDGRNGVLVPPEDVDAVARGLHRAIADDALVDKASALNATIIRERLDTATIKTEAIRLYERVARRETEF